MARRRRVPAVEREPPTPEQAWGRLLNWLGQGPQTRVRVAQRLRRWRVPDDVAADLQARLGELGLVDDDVYASALGRELARKGLRGPALEARLRTRGIQGDLARKTADDASPADPLAAAIELCRKRASTLPTDAAVARRRLVAYLVRRGYRQAHAFEAVRLVLGAEHQE